MPSPTTNQDNAKPGALTRFLLFTQQFKELRLRNKDQVFRSKRVRKDRKDMDRDATRQRKRAARESGLPFRATLVLIVLCTGSAVPSQYDYFQTMFASRGMTWILSVLAAVAIAVVVEGVTWHGAVYYRITAGTGISKVYRIETYAGASVAAAINYVHNAGLYSPVVGAAFAIASLLGVGAWELHMLRYKQVRTGMTVDEIRLWASRRFHHPLIMWEAKSIRATFGLQVGMETAWRMAWVRKRGNPTVPVAVTSDVATKLLGTAQGGTSMEASTGTDPELPVGETTGNGGVQVLEAEIDWSKVTDVGDLVSQYWPEVDFRPEHPRNTPGSDQAVPPEPEVDFRRNFHPDRNSTSAGSGTQGGSGLPPEAEHPRNTTSAQGGSHAEVAPGLTSDEQTSTPRRASGSGATSAGSSGITSARNTLGGSPGGTGTSGRKSSTSGGRGEGVEFRPTKAEVDASGGSPATERLMQYLARAERNNVEIDNLSRGYIAAQFGVSTRQVRTVIGRYNAKASQN